MKLTSVILPGGACFSEGESVGGGKERCGVSGSLGGPVLVLSVIVGLAVGWFLGVLLSRLFNLGDSVPCSRSESRSCVC